MFDCWWQAGVFVCSWDLLVYLPCTQIVYIGADLMRQTHLFFISFFSDAAYPSITFASTLHLCPDVGFLWMQLFVHLLCSGSGCVQAVICYLSVSTNSQVTAASFENISPRWSPLHIAITLLSFQVEHQSPTRCNKQRNRQRIQFLWGNIAQLANTWPFMLKLF